MLKRSTECQRCLLIHFNFLIFKNISDGLFGEFTLNLCLSHSLQQVGGDEVDGDAITLENQAIKC
jgi:hypothetical protein